MPYKNIVYAKLHKRLLNDPRWFSMPESCQLLYLKLVLIACETDNRVPKDMQIVRSLARSRTRLDRLKAQIMLIKERFPKFKENANYYYFEEFNEYTNYIPKQEKEILRKSQGKPKDVVEIQNSTEDKDIEKKNPDIKTFMDYWHTKYLEKFSEKYVFHGLKEGNLIKTMLKSIPLTDLKKKADDFFASEDQFIQEAGYTIGVFSSQINKLNKLSHRKSIL